MSIGLFTAPSQRQANGVCVEVEATLTLTSVVPVSAQELLLTYTNTLSQTRTARVSVAAPNTLAPAGLGVGVLLGGTLEAEVTVSFDRDFSGAINWVNVQSLDNAGPGNLDRLCKFSIGQPNVVPPNVQIANNCLTSLLGDVTPKSFSWTDVKDVDLYKFVYRRTSLGSSFAFQQNLVQREIQFWQSLGSGDATTYTDPETDITYNALPTGVVITHCDRDERRVISWNEQFCYEPVSGISYDIGALGISQDAYHGLRPRVDGVLPMSGAIPGQVGYEFSPDGVYLYSFTPAQIIRQEFNFSTGQLSAGIPLVFNLTAFPGTVGAWNPRGLAIDVADPLTAYIVHVNGADNNRVHLVKVDLITGFVTYVGDTTFNAVGSIFPNNVDLVVTNSGQLLLSYANNIRILNKTTGVITTTPVFTIPAPLTSANSGIFYISRYENGDILVAGNANPTLGADYWIVDGETYSLVDSWNVATSVQTPQTPIAIAYPLKQTITFNRVFVKDLDTGDTSYSDHDLFTGLDLTFPLGATVKKCTDGKDTTWFKELCYVNRVIPNSQGQIYLNNATGAMANAVGNCPAFAGFVPPVPNGYVSFTHSVSSNVLFALRPAANQIDRYDWTTKTTPAAPFTLNLSGYVGGAGEVERTIRIDWEENELYLLTEEAGPSNTRYRIYYVDQFSGIMNFLGEILLGFGQTNGSFTFGLNKKAYFTYQYSAGIWRVFELDLVTFTLGAFLLNHSAPTVRNLNTDVTTGNLLIADSTNNISHYSETGSPLYVCGNSLENANDVLYVPDNAVLINGTPVRFIRVFTRNSQGEISYQNIDYTTGLDVSIPSGALVTECGSTSESLQVSLDRGENCTVPLSVEQCPATALTPRAQLVTGITAWSKAVNAPNARSISFTRLANIVTINDGVSPAFNVNAAVSMTWGDTRDNGPVLGNGLVFTGVAAGSSFIVNWLE